MPTSAPLDGLKIGSFHIDAKELASRTMAAGGDAGTATLREALCQRANELVGGKVALSLGEMAKMTPEDTQRLFHELQVHQIELEVQNDELRRVQDALHTERERYFDLYELAPVGYCTVSEEGLILQINLTAATLLGTNRGVLLQQPISRLIYREDRDIYYLLCKRLQAGGEPQSNELRMLKDDGTAFWVELLATVVRDESDVSVLRIILNDVTARKQSEQAYRIAAIVFESHEGMTITDANQVILQVNKAFTEITGYTSKDAVGHTPRLLRSGRQDAVFYAEMWRNIARSGAWEGEIWNRRKNGEVFPEWLTITAVKDEKRVVSHYVATHSDITARKAADEQINNLAFYDPLTRLPNRRLLMDRLEQAVAACARYQHKGALMFIDLDGFKTINDTLGHHQGDLLLEQVATRLNTCIRDGDTVARLSGDEFVVMLELLSENVLVAATQAEAVGEKVLSTLNHRYQYARRTRTAWEAYNEGQGVCRDYAHLAIALCRCMNIPARYCTGYLGDIRIPPIPGPMDFAGWFEAYLGDRWYTFDARNNTPRIGRVLMARGRDACDVALASTFGPNTLQRFTVWADEVTPV